ncbi:MAG: N-acetylneuraminate synthase family protein [Bacteroidetes bacterium]|nr:N-acetylneuraminate synthase family protein [Bacteroidota bacterium]
MVYNIIEVANVHAGDQEYLKSLIKEFKDTEAEGIKFQPFKYDQIAKENFSWYEVYKKLYFDKKQWKQIIDLASDNLDVWIDTFDTYSVEVIRENLKKIKGLKFQSSILYNYNVLNSLKEIDLTNCLVILNISGIELEEIAQVVDRFKSYLKPKQIILQVGFQGYPTSIHDNGLNKIKILIDKYGCDISFADHIQADLEESIYLPVIASLLGAKYIEKHVCLSGPKPEYDHYSSLNKEGYQKYLETLKVYQSLSNIDFINLKERNYLNTTIQTPSLKDKKNSGQTYNLNCDFDFKRTSDTGLTSKQLLKLTSEFYVISNRLEAGSCIKQEDVKKANIAVIIACRLKSSRLPKKALLRIGDYTSVELCIKNAMTFDNVNHVILATSTHEEDAELKDYTYKPSVIFHKGDPIDVIQRYIDIIEKLKIDVIVRVTADMPFIGNEILQPILKAHFESGADYSRAKKAAIGTNLEIINSEALRRVKSYFPSADYSEYMTYYFTNNPDEFRINEIDLPENLVRDYRLTLDYPEDLELFNEVVRQLKEKGLEPNLINVIDYLDKNPDLALKNSGMEVKYFTDPKLIETLKKHTVIRRS